MPVKHPIDALMEELKKRLDVRTRSQVGAITGLTASVMSRARNNIRPVSPEVVLQIHDTSGMSIAEIRGIGGIAPEHKLYMAKVEA